MAQLEIRGLIKRFGDFVALKGLDLNVASGEFVSFLGPNGCGKTTALRIIAGFEHPTEGSVHVGGKDSADDVARVVGVWRCEAPIKLSQ